MLLEGVMLPGKYQKSFLSVGEIEEKYPYNLRVILCRLTTKKELGGVSFVTAEILQTNNLPLPGADYGTNASLLPKR